VNLGKFLGRGKEVMNVLERVATESKRFQNSLEHDDVAGYSEHTLLFVPVFLRGPVQELHENRVVQQLRAHHEPLHLLAHVDRHVPHGNSHVPAEGPGAARPPGVGAEERVLRGVAHARELANQLLHRFLSQI